MTWITMFSRTGTVPMSGCAVSLLMQDEQEEAGA